MVASFLLFGVIQFRDGPFIRPHPGIFHLMSDSVPEGHTPLSSFLESGVGHQPTVRARAGFPPVPGFGFGSQHDDVS